MIAGALDRRVTIQQLDGTQDSRTGQWKETWETYKIVWASKMSMRGRERLQANQVIAVGDEVWTVRYDSGITTAMRISHDSKTYEISSIEEIGRKEGLRLTTQRLG